MPKFTSHEKAEAAAREVKQRRRVYPRLAAMRPAEREYQIAIMEEIAEDYRRLVEAEPFKLESK